MTTPPGALLPFTLRVVLVTNQDGNSGVALTLVPAGTPDDSEPSTPSPGYVIENWKEATEILEAMYSLCYQAFGPRPGSKDNPLPKGMLQ